MKMRTSKGRTVELPSTSDSNRLEALRILHEDGDLTPTIRFLMMIPKTWVPGMALPEPELYPQT